MDRELNPEEVAAMWLYGAEYAKSGRSAIEWWKRLDESRKRVVRDFVEQMRRALASAEG